LRQIKIKLMIVATLLSKFLAKFAAKRRARLPQVNFATSLRTV
jgi:hypothetical protein